MNVNKNNLGVFFNKITQINEINTKYMSRVMTSCDGYILSLCCLITVLADSHSLSLKMLP